MILIELEGYDTDYDLEVSFILSPQREFVSVNRAPAMPWIKNHVESVENVIQHLPAFYSLIKSPMKKH
jgi:hypothetical protein